MSRSAAAPRGPRGASAAYTILASLIGIALFTAFTPAAADEPGSAADSRIAGSTAGSRLAGASADTRGPGPIVETRPSEDVFLPFREHSLENGLKILTLEDHSVPSVTYWTFFRAGSINERPGITGISHLFEHLMFRGAAKYGPGEFDEALESNGGYSNAWTDKDMTAYYEDIISEKLDLVVDLEADRLGSLRVTQDVLDPEREVVKEERRLRTENSILGSLDEVLDAAAYLAHPYRWPVIGWMADLDNITVEDCHAYFRTHYAPNNATVIVVGDFETGRLLKTLERALGKIPRQDLPRGVVNAEPEPRGERRLVYHKQAQVETFGIAYQAPAVDAPDFYAMEVLQSILASGESSRLYRRLVYAEQAAASVQAFNEWRRQTALFKIYVDMKPDRSAAEGERMVNEELARLLEEEVEDRELQKAKNQIRASLMQQMKTNRGKGQTAGLFESLWGDWRRHRDFLVRIDAVTKADIRSAARRRFVDLNKTIVTLVPSEPAPMEPGPGEEGGEPVEAEPASSRPGASAGGEQPPGAEPAEPPEAGHEAGSPRCEPPPAAPAGGAARFEHSSAAVDGGSPRSYEPPPEAAGEGR